MKTKKASKKVSRMDDFVAVILAHGRPDKCHTFHSLRRSGYTGKILILLDNEDKTKDRYEELFGAENVAVFDKLQVSRQYPNADNFDNRRAVVYARNASFQVVKSLGYRWFMQLDDDYLNYRYRVNEEGVYNVGGMVIRNMDTVFSSMLDFYLDTPCTSIAMSQGGDHVGGGENGAKGWRLLRKAMNSWICDSHNPFTFVGRMNEDVSAYVRLGVVGHLFFTIQQVMLSQVATQAAEGGMSATYAENGTYVKSFYTVMMQPSSVRIGEIGKTHLRLHHSINPRYTYPKVLREECRKP